jgi:hypothetical protein
VEVDHDLVFALADVAVAVRHDATPVVDPYTVTKYDDPPVRTTDAGELDPLNVDVRTAPAEAAVAAENARGTATPAGAVAGHSPTVTFSVPDTLLISTLVQVNVCGT